MFPKKFTVFFGNTKNRRCEADGPRPLYHEDNIITIADLMYFVYKIIPTH